ncbi:glycosyltransferase family 4 protein [Halomonas mongoliensis]|uniref:glycosyltransferase family 4 protein n=1 Tax=Halomonas mongoliensis TaxID=321265 RepID=UPI00403AB062
MNWLRLVRKFLAGNPAVKNFVKKAIGFQGSVISFRLERKLEKMGGKRFFESLERKVYGKSEEGSAQLYANYSLRIRSARYAAIKLELARKSVGWQTSALSLYSLFRAEELNNNLGEAYSVIERYNSLDNGMKNAAYSWLIENSPANELALKKLVKSRGVIGPGTLEGKRICYILSNSFPYSSGGYASRSQGVAESLNDRGWAVIAITRPGFPLDAKVLKKGEKDINDADRINGIEYRRLLSPSKIELNTCDYVRESASALESELMKLRPDVIVAASNYVCGLASLIAARNMGLSFIYEVRGFWEVSRASREPGFENTIKYKVEEEMEGFVARSADHVFTLTKPMKAELIKRGVGEEKISILPNCCDVKTFQSAPAKNNLKASFGIRESSVVIGYIGTFVDYEGLDDLAYACGILKEKGLDFVLVLVGNENPLINRLGEISERIRVIAKEKGFDADLIMPGRIPHDQVSDIYSIIDIAPFPRRPCKVCELVSPIKPLEALASEKSVVVSSVGALAEMVSDNETGLVFEKGSISDLANKLEVLVNNPALRKKLGENGRVWVSRERTWERVGEVLDNKIVELLYVD